MPISINIKRLREMHDLTQVEFAKIAGVSDKAVSTWENGIKEPRMGAIQKIADYFEIQKSNIIEDDGLAVHGTKPYSLPSNAILATGMAPIYGSIPAGMPAFAEQNIEGYMPIMLKNPQEYFLLRVKGDSMINAHIISGSLVIIHHQNTAENGEIVACRVNGDEATLKRFKQMGNTVFLMPENSAYEPIIVSCEDFEDGNAEIIGVVKQTVLDVK